MQALWTILKFPYLFIRDWAHYLVALLKWGRCGHFFRIDLECLLRYFFFAPYRLCLRSLKPYSEDQVQRAYGETFFTSLDLMMQSIHISKEDVVYELGCGRGRAAFFMHAVYGCQVVGVDLTPEFIDRANALVARYQLSGIRFEQGNLMDCQLMDASVIYIYATEFSLQALNNLMNVLRRSPAGARVVCVSQPLHFLENAHFILPLASFKVAFVWGRAAVYTYEILDSFETLL